MPIATGIAKQLRYKLQPVWGTPPGATGAQVLRRVSSDLALKKATFESNELLASYQRNDFRHGTRSIEGTIQGELSPGTWKDIIAAALRRAFSAVTAITGASITIAGAGPTYTVTRAAGSYLTDGIKAGMVVRLTAGTFNAANINKNLLVLSLTATVLTVVPLNGVALVAEGPIAAATVTVPGRITYVPQTGHLDQLITFEHWHSDLSLSERFDDCKVNQVDFAFPPQGMSTIGVQILGKDVFTGGAQYFTSPTGETTSGILAAPNGIMVAQGVAVQVLTGFSISVKGNMTAEPVCGSNVYADITEGQVTALFESAAMRDFFFNESEVSLMAALPSSPLAASEFMSLVLPRVKLSDASKDDGDKAIVQTLPFTALENVSGGAGQASERTTIWVQDSLAT
jgi:hypothetical protein